MRRGKELEDSGTATMIRNRETGIDHVVLAVEKAHYEKYGDEVKKFCTACHNLTYNDVLFGDDYEDRRDIGLYLEVYDGVESVNILRVCGHCMMADPVSVLFNYSSMGLDIDTRTEEHTDEFVKGNRTVFPSTSIGEFKELQEKYNRVVRKRVVEEKRNKAKEA